MRKGGREEEDTYEKGRKEKEKREEEGARELPNTK